MDAGLVRQIHLAVLRHLLLRARLPGDADRLRRAGGADWHLVVVAAASGE